MNQRYTPLTTVALTLALAACGSGSTKAAAPSRSASKSPTAADTSAPAATPTTAAKYPDQPSTATASAPCGTNTKGHAAVANKLPKGFPVVTGWVPTSSVTQGSTTAVRGVVTGLPSSIVTIRDEAFGKIIKAGYKKTGSDQEPGFEADGDFTPRGGNINVKTLCKDHLVVTYTFTS